MAAGVVRYVLVNFNAEGKTKKAIKKYKVMFAPSCIQEGKEFIGWWIVIPKPTTANDVLFEEIKGVVMAHLDPVGKLAGAAGGVIESAQGLHDNLGKLDEQKKRATGTAGITDRFSRAWAAGTYSAAKGTDSEFSLVWPTMVLGGAIHITEGLDTLTGSIRVYNQKADMMSLMGHGESNGGVKYCKEIADGGDKFIM